jgi:hypothetical protein
MIGKVTADQRANPTQATADMNSVVLNRGMIRTVDGVTET